MTEQVKRGRGRPRKVQPIVSNKPKEFKVVKASAAPVLLDHLLLTLINSKFHEAHGFELTQAQAHAFLINLVEDL